ncbi:sel1 repeat family protein [Helicobacter pylori]|uniref:tetratricopeptide repeat protein n=1 Tax=Helicobacter pylori TaxID=210 RepID=UPI00165B63BC|nr:tetratricopeptide repeat protein [Helicobacter pylori]WQS21372.1 sel1 repeat family protein [Helicobacter pylori]WQS30710.1 sel1 repeat family protein [Helicobacter pylori]
MLGSFKKAIFRALCLGALGLLGLMAEPNPEEIFNVGVKSYEEQDFEKAIALYKKACDLEVGGGCFNLGALYHNGQGVEKNLTKADQFYSKACNLKEGLGCNNLGDLYQKGEGVKQDSKKAAALFEKACKLGVQEACEMLKKLK